MPRTAMSVRLLAGKPVALVDHARAERPGLDQVQPNVFSDRRQEGCAASEDDGVAEHTQLVDEADQALYHSKRRGRNRVTHFHDLMAAVI